MPQKVPPLQLEKTTGEEPMSHRRKMPVCRQQKMRCHQELGREDPKSSSQSRRRWKEPRLRRRDPTLRNQSLRWEVLPATTAHQDQSERAPLLLRLPRRSTTQASSQGHPIWILWQSTAKTPCRNARC